MINLKQIVRGALMLTALYGVSGCDKTPTAVSETPMNGGSKTVDVGDSKMVDESPCPTLALRDVSPRVFENFEYQKGNYKIEVTDVDYGMQRLGGHLTIKDLSGDLEYQGYQGVLSMDPERLANSVNRCLSEREGKSFEENGALECLLAPVSEKYKALENEIEGN